VAAAFGAEDHLAWEARRRNGAAIAAAIAALFTFVGSTWRQLALADAPESGLVQSISRAAEPGSVGELESLRVASLEYYDDRAFSVLMSSVMVAIGFVALGWAVTYLAVATRARRPEFPRWVVPLPFVAGVLQGLSYVLAPLGVQVAIGEFLDGPRTIDAAEEIATNGLTVFAQLLGLPGALGLALALVFVGLNGMRVGLLTRFMGVLGMISGVLLIIQLTAQPVVLTFWLLMLAVLFAGRWPGGAPPAWRTGNAEPWPTSAAIREQRARAGAERRGDGSEPAEPEPVAAGPSPSASARKRKRKRR
jgi:amino acid transporter